MDDRESSVNRFTLGRRKNGMAVSPFISYPKSGQPVPSPDFVFENMLSTSKVVSVLGLSTRTVFRMLAMERI
jgi:hypothetical protein